MSLDSKERLAEQKEKYRAYVRSLPLSDRLRQLEALQEQSYEIMRVREANGGKPVPEEWQRWAKAREDREIKK